MNRDSLTFVYFLNLNQSALSILDVSDFALLSSRLGHLCPMLCVQSFAEFIMMVGHPIGNTVELYIHGRVVVPCCRDMLVLCRAHTSRAWSRTL